MEITFLGYIISQGSIKMDPKKVLAVVDRPRPSKMLELRSFLGLTNYYRRFIKGYSKIVSPLTDLLKKDQMWDWTKSCHGAFELIKWAISSKPVLKRVQEAQAGGRTPTGSGHCDHVTGHRSRPRHRPTPTRDRPEHGDRGSRIMVN